MQRANSLLEVRTVTDSDEFFIVSGIASTPTPDRYEDIVEPLGARFKTPMPFLLYHNSTLPVGNMTFAKPTKAGIPFEAKIPKVKEAGVVKDRVDEAIHSLKYKLIGAVSIGFRAIKGAYELLESGGIRFKEWEWLELSLVTVPAQADAVITGFKTMDAAKIYEVLGIDRSTDEEERRELIATFKSICTEKPPSSGRKGSSVRLIPAPVDSGQERKSIKLVRRTDK